MQRTMWMLMPLAVVLTTVELTGLAAPPRVAPGKELRLDEKRAPRGKLPKAPENAPFKRELLVDPPAIITFKNPHGKPETITAEIFKVKVTDLRSGRSFVSHNGQQIDETKLGKKIKPIPADGPVTTVKGQRYIARVKHKGDLYRIVTQDQVLDLKNPASIQKSQ